MLQAQLSQKSGCRALRGDLTKSPCSVSRLQSRRTARFVPRTAAGDGGIIGGGNAGGGKPPVKTTFSDGDDQPPKKAFGWKGWQDRVAYDPEFPFKVFLEQVIGVGASVIGDMSSRPNWGLNELDFVFSTMVVGSIMNFSLMYLLAPTAAAAAGGAASMGLIQRLLSDDLLRSWGAPGGNMFEPGFAVSKRLLNFGYKGLIFSTIGLLAGIVGTATSNGLLSLRKKLDPTFVTNNEAPNILFNAATWSAHMGFSSNLRYQVLGGTDRILSNVMPIGVFRVYSTAIRTLNNILGGISFVTLARLFGVQKAAGSDAAPATA